MSRAYGRLVPHLLSTRLWILFILLLAALLRLVGLNNLSPPGLAHDEVANWLIDRSILEGNHAVYFTDAYGHEAGFHYVQAASIALLGDHALALRLPAAFSGLLLVAISFALSRRLFGTEVAIVSAALLATLFYPVFYSRLGLRAISLPMVSALSAYCWWLGWQEWRTERDGQSGEGNINGRPPTWRRLVTRHSFLLAGFFAGISAHTYMAARAVPIFYAIFLLYLAFYHRAFLKDRWQNILSFWIIYLVAAGPLLVYLLGNPGSEYRISEIDGPLRAAMAGDLGPVLSNGIKILGMFGFAGDPLWRQNVARVPVYEPVLATLFYLSLPFCFRSYRDSRYAFLALWLITSTVPSMVTIDAPSTIRISNVLPVLMIFPAVLIHNSRTLSTVIRQLSTGNARLRMRLGYLILILYTIGLTAWALFRIWPSNNEVRFVWQAALTEAAAYLDASADDGPVAVGGWTPETMDPPTLSLSLRRNDLRLSFFDPTSTLIIPAAGPGESIRIVRPTILEFEPHLDGMLSEWGASTAEMNGFVLVELAEPPAIQPQFAADVLLSDELRFLGHDLVETQNSWLDMITYWRVVAPGDEPRRLFLHVVDDGENLLLEQYGLDRSDRRFHPHWQAGDTIIQHHSLPRDVTGLLTKDGRLQLRIGFFDPNSCPPAPCDNLQTESGEPYIELRLAE